MSYLTNIERVITTINVDGTTAGDYLIGITPSGPIGTRFGPLIVNVEPLDVASVGPGEIYPSLSVGINNPNYDNWLAITPLPALALNETILSGVGTASPAPSALRDTEVFVKVTTASTNIGTYRLRVSITGIWYQDGGVGP